MVTTIQLPLHSIFARYFTPDAKEAAYIARARERAMNSGLTLNKGHDENGRGVALVSSVSEPGKFHVVSGWRINGQRVYVCDCKAVDPHGDKTYTGFVTCKHAEFVRQYVESQAHTPVSA